MVFLYRPSDTTPDPSPNPWIGCRHLWTGWDGSEWDLSHGASGLKLLAGVRGMRMPPITRYSTRSAAVAGSQNRGHVVEERDVFWPLKVFQAGGSEAWMAHHDALWATLVPDKVGTWSVVRADGSRRDLRVRYTGLDDDTDSDDSSLIGWAKYGIQLIAENPWWLGEPTRVSFEAAGQTQPTGSYVIWIKSSYTLAQASITNTGDVEASPVWTVRGPCTTATVGVDGHKITFPITLGAGQWVRIDTDPTDQVAIDQDGNDRSSELTDVDFATIPAGANVPLQITMSGTGGVDCEVPSQHYRAL